VTAGFGSAEEMRDYSRLIGVWREMQCNRAMPSTRKIDEVVTLFQICVKTTQ